jgi:hypothetical protein
MTNCSTETAQQTEGRAGSRVKGARPCCPSKQNGQGPPRTDCNKVGVTCIDLTQHSSGEHAVRATVLQMRKSAGGPYQRVVLASHRDASSATRAVQTGKSPGNAMPTHALHGTENATRGTSKRRHALSWPGHGPVMRTPGGGRDMRSENVLK